jgi:hypothetical protein
MISAIWQGENSKRKGYVVGGWWHFACEQYIPVGWVRTVSALPKRVDVMQMTNNTQYSTQRSAHTEQSLSNSAS